MEGVLWKWTNYWTGWQPRWFVLDDGILVYYKSQEEVNQGCKGSLKISACEISVSQTDPFRLDVTVPGEQHFYLRASTSHERQQWLVALGSAKACEGMTKDATIEPVCLPVCEEKNNLKSKRSELRLYCDLLMQQVHSVKHAATQAPPDIEKLDESTHLLTATCDTFISTLEECLRLAKAEFTYQLPHTHPSVDKLNNGYSYDPPHSPAPISPSDRKVISCSLEFVCQLFYHSKR
ncbi:hypothetical protein GHT06_012328 [Daphnia sinensis]|uniref:PH domain-containing protein n=1 Tax=Daphnia sinensis TaxID=1820382 RepID=A0AAD5LEQ7_9CRUS|nr:hypothetical protein GHT06_012328 [Daphnia sinensis]